MAIDDELSALDAAGRAAAATCRAALTEAAKPLLAAMDAAAAAGFVVNFRFDTDYAVTRRASFTIGSLDRRY